MQFPIGYQGPGSATRARVLELHGELIERPFLGAPLGDLEERAAAMRRHFPGEIDISVKSPPGQASWDGLRNYEFCIDSGPESVHSTIEFVRKGNRPGVITPAARSKGKWQGNFMLRTTDNHAVDPYDVIDALLYRELHELAEAYGVPFGITSPNNSARVAINNWTSGSTKTGIHVANTVGIKPYLPASSEPRPSDAFEETAWAERWATELETFYTQRSA